VFVHLAAKTCYSLRDGVIRPRELAQATAERGMDAVGVADRDGLYGAVRVAQACAEAGVRPIFGADLRVEDGTRVALTARTQDGYANLCRLISAHHLAHERGQPVATWEQLSRHAGARGAGPGASGWFALLDTASERAVRRWMDLVGPTSVLLGVTHHLARGDDARARRRFRLADRLGLRAVANQAPRYLTPADARLADFMDAARDQVPIGPHHSQRRGNTEGYLKDPQEMARVFAERPDAIANTAWVAERCTVDLGLGTLRPPDFVGSTDPVAELRGRCEAGVRERYPDHGPEHFQRLDSELAMVGQLGLAGYFLTVAEIVERIHAKQIMVACRGSAAGSLICYALRISDVDPIAHDLVFERFANPYRDELPDIDIDVESARREDVYRDLLDRYGEERVACVTMVETYQARMAIREVGKALGIPAAEIGLIAKSFPRLRARDVRTAMATLPELAGRNLDAPHYRLLFDAVERIDGMPRHLALHPSGVLLADDHLRDLVPMERSYAGFPMAQFDKDDVEALGLCKLDVLAVRMLSAMAHGIEEARRARGVEVHLDDVPWDDEATFELIRSTRTIGCFQIESPGQRELIGRFQPTELGDLVVDISLFRPGPVKADMVGPFLRRRLGEEATTFHHPLLEPALAETHGVIVYHEQVMRCVAAVTGCDLATADSVRRMLGDPDAHADLRQWVVACALERGLDLDTAERLWTALAQFASFGFCKAHAAAFSVPTYRSAWMKVHHGPELIAGLLTHDPGMYPRRLLLEEARQLGIAVLPLDVNRSDRVYRVERLDPPTHETMNPWDQSHGSMETWGRGWGIRLALQDVAGIDDAMIGSILANRSFTDLVDLRRRAALNAPVAEALAHVGALDCLAPEVTRRDLLLATAELWHGVRRPRGGPEQFSLLPPDDRAGLGDYTLAEQVRAELEVLGLDASAHVLSFYRQRLEAYEVTWARDLLDCRDGQRVRVAGVKVATQTPPVRSGKRVIFLSLDDGTGVSDAAFFEHTHAHSAATVFHSWLLVVQGRVRRSGARGVSITAERAWNLLSTEEAPRRMWHASGGSAGG
jgi:error-prone DNA polymerase